MELSEIIVEQIKKEGPMCFQQFMETCLYHPAQGYYTSNRNHLGKEGDFYTAVCLTPVFGALIARQLEEMWHIMDEKPFTIVEYGAGTGALCHDILQHLQSNNKMYDQLRYCIIEKSQVMRAIEKEHLHEKVSWYERIEEIADIHGCILSNELVDNFSIHQVVMQKELMEVFVDYQDGFTEILRPAKELLKNYMTELSIELAPDFRTEINLQAVDWIKDIAAALNKGFVMTIDYGCQSADLYKLRRSQGTLLCYHRHSINDFVYEHIGDQDITSHVNFSALIHWGSANGLNECGFTDQCRFLLDLGFKEYLNEMLSWEKDVIQAARKAAVLSRTLLVDMGSKFKVLIQEKGLGRKELSGLRGLTV